ncbi:hypothetical protein P3T31_002850 [Rhizobium sp. AN70]|nr:hypothetical protein [Rhizobium sp. AN70]
MRATLLTFVRYVKNVAALAIKSSDNQFITFLEKLDDRCQLGSVLATRTG